METKHVYEKLQWAVNELKTAGQKEYEKGGVVCRDMQITHDVKDDLLTLYAVMGVYAVQADFIPVEVPSEERVLEVTALALQAVGVKPSE